MVAHDPVAADIAAVEPDCSVIRPHAGHLIYFDASEDPHYGRPPTTASSTRIVAVMNFYTKSCPESTRPSELNRHLHGGTSPGPQADGHGRKPSSCSRHVAPLPSDQSPIREMK